jgi:hypothetical protein
LRHRQGDAALLARGFDVTCVELGPNLAAQARELGVTVHLGRFEELETGERFDLVFAATAWHWLDPELRYGKAHAVACGRAATSRSGERRTHCHQASTLSSPRSRRLRRDRRVASRRVAAAEPGDDHLEIEATGLFGDVQVRRYLWELQYTADEYIALLDTFSGHIEMTDAQRARLYGEIRERLGGRKVRRHWLAVLHVARRIDM